MTRRAIGLLVAALLVAVAVIGGLLRVRVDTGTEAFLSANDPSLAAVQQKARDFGGDPVIVMLRYPGDGQFVTEREKLFALLKAEGQLSRLPDVATVYGPATVLNQLAKAAQNWLAELGGRREALLRTGGEAAATELDRQYLPLLVQGMPVGLPTLSNPRFAQSVIFGPDGRAKPEWRFIVPAPDAAVVLVRPRENLDQAGTSHLVTAIRSTVDGANLGASSVTVSGVPTVTAELAAEVSREGPLLGGLVALVVLLRFLLVPTPGFGRWARLRPLLSVVLGGAATLALFGWLDRPLSFVAVLLAPLLLGIGSSFPLYLATVPNRRRVLVMSLASSLAFLALALSPLPFVRDLGLALAAGIVFTVLAALALNGPVRPEPEAEPIALREPPSHRARSTVVSFAVLVAALGWAVLPRLTVAANPVELAGGLPALTDARTVESVLGASGEIGVRLDGPDVISPEALVWAKQTQSRLAVGFAEQLRPVVSAADLLGFLGDAPTREQISAALTVLPRYLTSSVVRPDNKVTMLVYGVRLQDIGAQQRMLASVRAVLPEPPAGYQVDVVGLPVAAVSGYQLLLDDRYPANLAGIVVAGLALAFGLRRRFDAARAVAAAAVATGWGLAALWLLGIPLSPLTVALGSLVTVTGCEFVVLLAESDRGGLPWLRRGVAYACLTSVLGYVVLALSRLWMVREFGLVLAAAVLLSYLAARLVVWLYPVRRSTDEGTIPVHRHGGTGAAPRRGRMGPAAGEVDAGRCGVPGR